MGLSIKQISIKLLLILMAFQVINLSVDSLDFDPIESPNTTSFNFNYYNSLIEYVTESMMGNVNAFPEYQNESNKNKSQVLAKHISLKLYQSETIIPLPFITEIRISHFPKTNDNYKFLYSKEINQPPSIS